MRQPYFNNLGINLHDVLQFTHLLPKCVCLWEMTEQVLEVLARFCQFALAQSGKQQKQQYND